jgi:hypothetical protein
MANLLISQFPDLFFPPKQTNLDILVSDKSTNLATNKVPTIGMMEGCNPTIDYVNLYKSGLPFYQVDLIAASLSVLALLIIALVILSDEKMKAHPNQMIAYVFLCDAFLFC